jgi:hypothetical protein
MFKHFFQDVAYAVHILIQNLTVASGNRLLRDFLRANPTRAEALSAFKSKLLEHGSLSVHAYTAAKTAMMKQLYLAASVWAVSGSGTIVFHRGEPLLAESKWSCCNKQVASDFEKIAMIIMDGGSYNKITGLLFCYW